MSSSASGDSVGTTSTLPARGACYGYEIRSALNFRYLRSGGGDPLEILTGVGPDRQPGELLRTWDPPDFPICARLHGDGRGYQLWNEDAGWFSIDPERGRVIVPEHGDPVRREERVWGLPVMLCFLARGDLALHASCVEIDGKALVLAAPRRFGKTTLAAAFAAAGYRVLAEDLVCLRPGPVASVVPGPAMLRVRVDVADAVVVPGAEELGRDGDRAHLSLEGSRGTCDPVPLGGIALLLQGDVDPRVDRIDSADVVRDLWLLSFKLPGVEDMQRCFSAVTGLAFAATTWSLTRRLRIEDLSASMESLIEALRAERGTEQTGRVIRP